MLSTYALTQPVKRWYYFILDEEWSDSSWLDEESRLVATVETTRWWWLLFWLLSLLSSLLCESQRPTLSGFVLWCEKYHSFPEPPFPVWRSGMWHSAEGLSGDYGASIWMWHIPVGAIVFIRPLILSLWTGLVAVTLKTQPLPSQPQDISTLGRFHLIPKSETFGNAKDPISV